MEDNRRTTHSVDDYYPKPSRDEEPSQDNLSNRPDAEDTDANDTRADRTDSYGSYADASDENGGAGFSDNSRDEDPYGQSSHSSEEYAGGTLTCPRCGMTLSEFTRTGHLGCPKCYEAFREQLQPMLLQIHGRVQHAGRQPLSTAEEQRKRSATEQLQRQMEQAVALEDFETAAKLRDQIRALSVSGEEEA